MCTWYIVLNIAPCALLQHVEIQSLTGPPCLDGYWAMIGDSLFRWGGLASFADTFFGFFCLVLNRCCFFSCISCTIQQLVSRLWTRHEDTILGQLKQISVLIAAPTLQNIKSRNHNNHTHTHIRSQVWYTTDWKEGWITACVWRHSVGLEKGQIGLHS